MATSVSQGGSTGGSGFDYYAQNAGEYYNQKEQTPGTWHGKGLESVGLKEGQAVEKQAFDNLAKGYSIDGSQALVYNAGRENHRETYDITYSPDKSVSIAREFGGQAMQEKIDRAMEKAVLSTTSMVESELTQYRETHKNETLKVDSDNLVFATFKHDTPRPDENGVVDPGAHIHAVFMNLTKTPDGSFKALEVDKIFKAQTLISRTFTNEFAKELVGEGIAIELTEKGFKIAGVDDAVSKEFSKRSQEMAKKYDELRALYPNKTEPEIKEMAALMTRHAKDLNKVTSKSMQKEWKERADALSIDVKAELEKAQKQAKETGHMVSGGLDMSALEAAKAAVNDLTNKESVISKNALISKALEYSVGTAVKSDIEKSLSELKEKGEIIEKNGNFTTKENIEMQKSVEDAMKKGIGAVKAIADNEQIMEAVKKHEAANNMNFTKEQVEAMNSILKSPDRYQDLQGVAGAGKTDMLEVINKVAQQNGYNVVAISFQGKAADEMAQRIGAEAMTIESFKNNYEVKSNDIIINDEAGMTSLKDMNSIKDKIENAGARGIFTGDMHQIQSLGAGKTFKESQKFGLTVTQLKESMRQKDPDYKQVVKDFNQDKIDKAFDKMQKDGKIKEVMGDRAMREETLAGYNRLSRKGETKIVTNKNIDKNYYNKEIQKQNIKDGKVTGVRNFTVKENKNFNETQMRHAKNYQIGDIIFLKKDAAGLGNKGAEFKVTEIDKMNNTLKLENSKVTNFHFDKLNTSQYSIQEHSTVTDAIDKNKAGTMSAHSQTITDITNAGDKISVDGTKLTHMEYHLDLKDPNLVDKIGGVARETTRDIGVGDAIKFTKNDGKYAVKNGKTGTVKEIKDDNTITAEVDMGKGKKEERTIKMNEYNHIDLAYANTVDGFQGGKSDNIVASLKSQMANRNNTYGAITRGVNDYSVVTDNTEQLKENSKHEQVKTSSSDMLSKEDVRSIEAESRRQSERNTAQQERSSRAAQQQSRVVVEVERSAARSSAGMARQAEQTASVSRGGR